MNRPVIKSLIIYAIPGLLSVIGIILSLEELKRYKYILISAAIVLLVLYVFSMIFYTKEEKEKEKAYQELCNENIELKATIESIETLLNTNNSIITSFVTLINPWHSKINKIANDICLNGKVNENDWDYANICSNICVACNSAIKQFASIENDNFISVSFIKYIKRDQEDYVKMIAHSSFSVSQPDVFEVEETLSDCRYQYAVLIREKRKDAFILENNEKIRHVFYKKHDTTDLSKYSQYIAIPVYCTKNRILGVLQITTKYSVQIMDTEVKLRSFSETYVTPFVQLLILVEKIQKGLFIQPRQ